MGGGQWNTVQSNASFSVIGGGFSNTNNAPYSTIPGGSQNVAGGKYSLLTRATGAGDQLRELLCLGRLAEHTFRLHQ